MSYANVVYPQFSNEDLDLSHTSRWHVREEEDEYGNKPNLPVLTQLSNLSDFITEKLTWVVGVAGGKTLPRNRRRRDRHGHCRADPRSTGSE